MVCDKLIYYQPPKSVAFGHTPKTRDIVKAWQETLFFLNQHTEFSPYPSSLEIQVMRDPRWTDPEFTELCVREARLLFGEPELRDPKDSFTWRPPIFRLEEAISFALRDSHRPRQEMGPTRVHFFYTFNWKRDSRDSLKERSSSMCRLGVSLGGRRLFLGTSFFFPFSEPTGEFAEFIADIQRDLPFDLKEPYFMTAIPTKSGHSYKYRKLAPGWMRIPN